MIKDGPGGLPVTGSCDGKPTLLLATRRACMEQPLIPDGCVRGLGLACVRQ